MYDVVVIGGGPGGYAAAIRASQLGAKVALVEANEIGGTCVNLGCIPTKVWLRAAYLLDGIRGAEQFGIKATVEETDLKTIVARKNGVAGDIRMGMKGLLGNNGVEVVQGRAVLKTPTEVDVEGTKLEAGKVILATGSSLANPEVPGLDKAALTTDEILEMKKTPSSVLVWGKIGVIEVEMATLLNVFGCKVVIASELKRILPDEDGETSQRVAQALKERGVEIIPGVALESVSKTKGGFQANLSGSKEEKVKVAGVLVSAREPNTRELGLDQVGVELDEEGFVKVNERLETSVPGIYAIGDVTGGTMLSHASSAMAVTAAENAMGDTREFPFRLVPRGIWTIPEVAAVGLSEEEADQRGIEVEVGNFPYSINGLAMVRNQLTGAVKIVKDAQYGEIVGVHIVGANATDLIGEAVLAMQLEATAEDLAKSIRVHPTFSENVMDAARDAETWALYLPKR